MVNVAAVSYALACYFLLVLAVFLVVMVVIILVSAAIMWLKEGATQTRELGDKADEKEQE